MCWLVYIYKDYCITIGKLHSWNILDIKKVSNKNRFWPQTFMMLNILTLQETLRNGDTLFLCNDDNINVNWWQLIVEFCTKIEYYSEQKILFWFQKRISLKIIYNLCSMNLLLNCVEQVSSNAQLCLLYYLISCIE